MITDFKQVIEFYRGEPHQAEAIDWLWSQTAPFLKEEFTRLWRVQPAPVAPTPRPGAPGSRKTNAAGIALIKEFEGFVSQAYLCPAGVWTVGYGTTMINGRPVNSQDHVTQQRGEELLIHDLDLFERAVNAGVRVPVTSNQFSALVSFTYNVGSGAFGSSTLLRLLNSQDYAGAAQQFARWNRGGGVILPGLVRRRQAEVALFNRPD